MIKNMNWRKKTKALLFFSILTILAAVYLFPVYISLINSFKSKGELFNNVLQFPQHVTFDNYITALKKLEYVRSFYNSFVVTVFSVVGIVMTGSLAGYKLARTPGKLSDFLLVFFVIAMVIPFQTVMITLVKVTMELRIYGKLFGLALVHIGIGVNMSVFLYHRFTKSTVPKETDEAAYMDGCNQLQTFFKIVFPMLTPITTTVIIINAVYAWNDYLTSVIILSNYKKYTLILQTRAFFSMYTVEWSLLMAGIVLISLPITLFYLASQKRILSGIVSGAVKG